MPDRIERENSRAERRPHSEKRAALERGRQGTEADDSGSGKGAELTIGSANRNDGWFQMAEAGEKSWKWVHSFFPTSSGCATMLRALPHNSSAALANAFSAICFLQKSRFTSSKPSISAIASDKKCIRHRTNSFVRYCLRIVLHHFS